MNILFLTTSERPDNGYAVVGVNVCKGLAAQPDVSIDIHTSAEKRRLLPGRHSLKSVYVERLGWVAILYDLACLLLTTRGRRYDLIHCNVEHFAAVAMLLAKWWRVPYTVTAHGTYGVVLPRKMPVFRRAFEASARLACVSRYTESRVLAEGVRAHTAVIPNGVDTATFRPNRSVVKENRITFVGNLKRRKGFPFLLGALQRAKALGADFRLVVVGNVGALTPDIRAKIESSGVAVDFTGPVAVEQLVHEYQRAKLNVLPSLSEPLYFEGFGLIHLEASACGTLTAGTRDSGNAEAILPGNGYLVDYGDVEALANIVTSTMSLDDPSRLAPGVSALRDWAQVAQDYGTLFRAVLVGGCR